MKRADGLRYGEQCFFVLLGLTAEPTLQPALAHSLRALEPLLALVQQ